MLTESEEILARINKNIFFREFSFAMNEFTPPGKSEVQFADHVIWIDDLMIVYQAKGRGVTDGSPTNEENWFKNEVLGTATGQVRRTLEYLADCKDITIKNQRGHKFNVGGHPPDKVIKLVIYTPDNNLPESCSQIRHYMSTNGGFMHVVSLEDYEIICNTLVTPAEVVEYFMFRQAIIEKWPEANLPSEAALIGQYLHGGGDEPSESFNDSFETLINELDDFDISGLLSQIGDKQENYESEYDYYGILAEFAKLNRGELPFIKERFYYCLDKVKNNLLAVPTRVLMPRTQCCFMFLPLQRDQYKQRTELLNGYTLACKYDSKVHRQIGVSFVDMNNETDVYINWSIADFQWQPDPRLEANLKNNNAFSPLKETGKLPRYDFEDS